MGLKSYFGLFVVMLFSVAAHARDGIGGYYTASIVSISTSAWTLVPATQNDRRKGMYVNVPATLNANMVGILGDCSSIASTTTIRPIEFIRGEESQFFELNSSVCLWMLSLHSADESVHVQEVR